MDDTGRSPLGPGHSAEPEPSCTVSAVPASVPNALRLFAFAVHLHKHGEGASSSNVLFGSRLAISDDEARGMAYSAASVEMPDYSVFQIVVSRIPDASILTAASGIETQSAETEGLSPKGESPVGEAETPNTPHPNQGRTQP